MATLQAHVEQRLPVAVVALAGTVGEPTVGEAEAVLWECLAHLPDAVVVDATALAIEPAGWQWLKQLRHRVDSWPGGTLCLAGFPGPMEDNSLDCFASVAQAVAAQRPGGADRRRDLVLPPHPRSCAHARELAITICTEWEMGRQRRLAELLLSELVANGVRHARTELVVTMRVRDGSLELSVKDQSPIGLPALTEDPRGFGLQLVDQLSERWGWVQAGRGKVVWSRLPA